MNPLRCLPVLLLPLIWGFAASCANDDIASLPKVVLLPLGGVDDALIEAVVRGAEGTYRLKVVVLKNEDFHDFPGLTILRSFSRYGMTR